jgi:hypothetical protein
MVLLTFLLQNSPPWEGFVRHWNLEELAEGSPALPHIPHQQPVSWYVRFHLTLKKGASVFIQDLVRSHLSLGALIYIRLFYIVYMFAAFPSNVQNKHSSFARSQLSFPAAV